MLTVLKVGGACAPCGPPRKSFLILNIEKPNSNKEFQKLLVIRIII